MSLRARLLLSYALVIFTCVAIIFIALLFLLRDAPVQRRLVAGRLALEAGVVSRLLRLPLQTGAPPEQIIRRLQNLGERTDTRILLINGQSGQVLGDTAGALTGRNLFASDRPQRFNNTLNGEFDDGEHWLYSTGQLLNLANPIEVAAVVQYEAATPFRDPVFRELLQPLAIASLCNCSAVIARSVVCDEAISCLTGNFR